MISLRIIQKRIRGASPLARFTEDRLSHCPVSLKRATPKAPRKMNIIIPTNYSVRLTDKTESKGSIYTPNRGVRAALFLTNSLNLRDSSSVKTKAFCKRLLCINVPNHSLHQNGTHGKALQK